ncbi:hypothetical protein BDZ45DRAFT_768273 [Acephala macrosclerotiorum]|nr:hypothetical protein BDZ45DRAFT_768273 [Acephala macrosclerotiorum]
MAYVLSSLRHEAGRNPEICVREEKRVVGKFETTSDRNGVSHAVAPHCSGVSDHTGLLGKTHIDLNKQILMVRRCFPEEELAKTVGTVFDVICRLAEDGVTAADDQDMYAAILCFGLRHVNTCDLLALLEERTKVLKSLDIAEVEQRLSCPTTKSSTSWSHME